MKQLIRLTILSCACAALALTVVAGPEALPSGKEMKQVAPAPLPECNWTGFYIGLNVGGQFGHSEDKDLDDFNYPDRPWGYSESGVVAGGQVGYNYQWNWLVLGVEADGGYMNLEGRGAEPGFDSDAFGESDSDFYTTFRGRIGVAVHSCLLYATGGGIGVNYETRFIDDIAMSNDLGLVDAHKQEFDWGYTVGGGIEHMFGCHWSIKAEYLYFALDKQEFSGINTQPLVGNFGGTLRFTGDTAGHIVRAGLNYKF